MSLLLLFHPAGEAPPPEHQATIELPHGGGAAFSYYQVHKKKIERDEDELLQIIALVVPLIGRR